MKAEGGVENNINPSYFVNHRPAILRSSKMSTTLTASYGASSGNNPIPSPMLAPAAPFYPPPGSLDPPGPSGSIGTPVPSIPPGKTFQ